jgi:hypothetical protein
VSEKVVSARRRSAYLDRIEDLDHARMAQGSELLESIFGEGKPGLVGCYVEGEYAARRPVFLDTVSAKIETNGLNTRLSTYSLGSIVQSKDGFVNVDLVAKVVRERWPFCNSRGDGGLEKVHVDLRSVGARRNERGQARKKQTKQTTGQGEVRREGQLGWWEVKGIADVTARTPRRSKVALELESSAPMTCAREYYGTLVVPLRLR